jgi:hypothetical protein
VPPDGRQDKGGERERAGQRRRRQTARAPDVTEPQHGAERRQQPADADGGRESDLLGQHADQP